MAKIFVWKISLSGYRISVLCDLPKVERGVRLPLPAQDERRDSLVRRSFNAGDPSLAPRFNVLVFKIDSMKKYYQLALISFTILFSELLLIRLVGTEVRIFAYLSNLVLLAIFVGSGVGMLVKRGFSLRVSALLLLIIVFSIQIGLFSSITNQLGSLNENTIWFQPNAASLGVVIGGLFLTILLFFLILFSFIPLGQYLGDIFEDSKRIILGYSINVAAAILGMWAFYGSSLLALSPFIGIIIVQLILILLSENKKHRLSMVVILVFTVAMGLGVRDQSIDWIKTVWSPYLIKSDIQNVLIIGAGGGNDAAAAIRAAVPVIDAVEIDPQIIALGKKYHPENPYSSSRVNIVIDDGRSFFRQTDKKYDLVVMGLADSHTLSSSLTNIRLDHYLYTKESIEEVKKLLKPDGLLYLSFEVSEGSQTGAKIEKNLHTVFGNEPVIFKLRDTMFFGFGGVIFLANSQGDILQKYLNKNLDLKKFVEARRVHYDTNIKSLTDNWPYLYLGKPQLPSIHLWISFFLIILFLLLRKVIAWQGKFDWGLFALGGGFLLYEFQNVSKTSRD